MDNQTDGACEGGHGYDVPMIRDFLEHLQWEVRICHAESSHLGSEPNEELAEALAECMRRRGAVALLTANVVQRDGATDDEVDKASQLLREFNEKRMALYLKALDGLASLFHEALVCAESKSFVMRNFKARDVIARLDKKE